MPLASPPPAQDGKPPTAAPPRLLKPGLVLGQQLVFREAGTADADFILQLRTDPVKGRHLSATENDLAAQRDWLQACARDHGQLYFIIEDRAGERCGTVRLYDVRQDSFCWGSWILKDGCPSSYALESALMVYAFALGLGFRRAHFSVRRDNESVWKFHERFGAERCGEDGEDLFFDIGPEAIERSMARYRRFLPAGVQILRA